MAEEHRCQAPKLCANNCGFFGSLATLNFCSKCYQDLRLKEQQSSNAKLVLDQSLTTAAEAVEASSFIQEPLVSATEVKAPATADEVKEDARTANRCRTCRRRVGLTGYIKCSYSWEYSGTVVDCCNEFNLRNRSCR